MSDPFSFQDSLYVFSVLVPSNHLQVNMNDNCIFYRMPVNED